MNSFDTNLYTDHRQHRQNNQRNRKKPRPNPVSTLPPAAWQWLASPSHDDLSSYEAFAAYARGEGQ